MFPCFHNFLTNCKLNPTVHIPKSTRLSPNNSLLEPKANKLSRFLFELGTDIDKASLSILEIEHTSKTIIQFVIIFVILIKIDDRIEINNPIPYKIVSTYFFMIHCMYFQITTINFITAVYYKLELFVEMGFLASFLYYFWGFLLVW